MKTHFDIEKIVEKGIITNELNYDRALIADRKLRILAKDNLYFKVFRKKPFRLNTRLLCGLSKIVK